MADVSFGVEAAARQFGLDFIRIITEDYYFVCREGLLATAPMRRLLDIMRGVEFQNGIAALPGYAAVDTGVIKTIDDAFEGKRSKRRRE
jgi:molybdate-binding protein